MTSVERAPTEMRLGRSDWITLALIFAGAWLFLAQDNTFPFYGHPDEPGKAEQVLSGRRNFNHPALMLNTTAVVQGLFGGDRDYNRVTQLGRWVVAGYAAGAVALLAWLVVRLWGERKAAWRVVGLVASAVLIASTPQLFEFAHYFKEDPVLCFGLAAFLLAADLFSTHPSRRTLAGLAVAMGVAIGSKYVGAVVLPFGLWLIWQRSREAGWWSYRVPAGVVALALVALVFLVINYQSLRNPLVLWHSIVSEAGKAMNRPDGIARPIPNAQGWLMLTSTTSAALWVFLGAALIRLGSRIKRIRLAEVALVLIPLFIAISTCFVDKMAERYFLPVSTLVSTLAALGLLGLASWIGRRHGVVTAVVMLAGLGWVVQSRWASLAEIKQDHQGDPRRELALYIRDHLPPSAVILSDKRVRLPNDLQPENDVYHLALPQKVLLANRSQFAADFAPFEELKARGVTYVALCDPDFSRFFQSDGQPIASTDPRVLKRVAFYRRVLTQGKLVWSSPARNINIVWPGLRLYELPAN